MEKSYLFWWCSNPSVTPKYWIQVDNWNLLCVSTTYYNEAQNEHAVSRPAPQQTQTAQKRLSSELNCLDSQERPFRLRRALQLGFDDHEVNPSAVLAERISKNTFCGRWMENVENMVEALAINIKDNKRPLTTSKNVAALTPANETRT